jgi:1-acyl-sn-glycerol-3-phosphate acyltransferase
MTEEKTEEAIEHSSSIPPRELGWYPFYWCFRVALRVIFLLFWRWKQIGKHRLPVDGPVVVVSNHASFLDPMLLGTFFDRPMGFMARRTLFRGLFGYLIRKLYAFPIERDGDPRAALRAMGDRLAQGLCVIMFPEGTRTRTGFIGKLKRGIGMISVRNHAPVMPVYLGGAYDSWPRTRKVFRFYPLHVEAGEPIYPKDCGDDRQAAKEEEARIHAEVTRQLKELEEKYLRMTGKALPAPADSDAAKENQT